MRQAGYNEQQIQMYFREQMRQQMQQQAGQSQQQQIHAQQQMQAQQMHRQQQQQSAQNHQTMSTQPTQSNPHANMNQQQQQQAKQQMARNIVQAYTGRVSLQQVMEMPFERVQGLHNEIISRLNQNGQHPQAQPQQPQYAQNNYTQQQYAAHPNAQNNVNTNVQTTAPQTTSAPSAMPLNTQSSNNPNADSNGRPRFDNENPIDIVLVLLHQYPQIETWLQSMEYHDTVTSSRTHAVQFLTSLMDSQPQFTQLIKLIQQQLKSRRAQQIIADPNANAAANQQLMAQNANQQQMMNTNAMNGNGMTNGNVRAVDHDASRKKKRSKKKKDKSSKRKSKKDKKM